MNPSEPSSADPGSAVAVIGMACRYPGAATPAAFWENLKNGVDAVTFFSEDALIGAGVDPDLVRNPAYVPAGRILSSVEDFDADFFGFSPREAAQTDIQHRLFLECAWEALESGGYPSEERSGPIGVFAGSDLSAYFLERVYPALNGVGPAAAYGALIGNDKDFLPTMVSYKLNLKGPSICIQTACSSSLVAVHLACQSLLGGECDLALAGGVGVSYPQEKGYLYEAGMILSPDGVCRPFDADARGTVPGSGAGVVLLKRLEDALAHGDAVQAVIRGSAINNDGALKAGFTAPGVAGQAAVIAEAQALAGVPPERIGYIEAHGTGTELGDPIEIESLIQAFGTNRRAYCPIGSVKGNIGHTGAASGVAGLIKTVLALRHRMIPPSLHFKAPNPGIDFEHSPFFVNSALRDWRASDGLRLAGVSSFGIGGTNAHVVVEEPPATDPGVERATGTGDRYLLPLSAAGGEALAQASASLADYLAANPEIHPADAAYTLQVGRKHFSHRRFMVVSDLAEAVRGLRRHGARPIRKEGSAGAGRSVVFMFPGQGAQYPGMGRALYETAPIFREALDRCAGIFQASTGADLMAALYPAEEDEETASGRLARTDLAQPAIFAVSYAAARLWMDWGIPPDAMIGHSIGEYAAACLAGVFSLEDAMALVAARGALMAARPTGSMLAVMMSETDLATVLALPDFIGLSLAAVNGDRLCSVSGETDIIHRLETHLSENGESCRRLHTSHAFHSAMMDPVLDRFSDMVGKTTLHPPKIPFISNLTGTWIAPEEAASPHYWTRQLRQTVRFAEGLEALLAEPRRLLLEVGPGRTLATFARQVAQDRGATVFHTLRHPRETAADGDGILTALGRLWASGVEPDWDRVNGDKGRRIPLPTYPFQRKPHVVGGPRKAAGTESSRDGRLTKRDLCDWFYLPSWKRTPFLPTPMPGQKPAPPAPMLWLVFEDGLGLGRETSEVLSGDDDRVARVRTGPAFTRLEEDLFVIDPDAPEDYRRLLAALKEEGCAPDRIAHFWSIGSETDPTMGFRSLVFLAQAIAGANMTAPMSIALVSNGLQEVTGDEPLTPADAALAMGPVRVIPQEYPHIQCRAIDVSMADHPAGAGRIPEIAERLAAELRGDPPPFNADVAHRGRYRWIRIFESLSIEPAERLFRLRSGGVYFVTGGLGKIGLLLADHLTAALNAKVVLMGRSSFPEPAAWGDWIARRGVEDAVSRKIASLKRIMDRGGEVLLLKGDVANADATAIALKRAEERFGPIDGVIHAAGATGVDAMKPIHDLSPADWETHFGPKVRGVQVLADLLRDRRLDFCLLMSSLSSVLGGLGFCAYAAANRFMDAFAQRRNRTSPFPWISVNWDGWAVGDTPDVGPGPAGPGIEPAEGMTAFDRLLSVGGVDQVVVSTGDLDARFQKWVAMQPADAPAETSPRHERPELTVSYEAPRTDPERAMAEIFGELLGIREVGIHDNFFDLGGHSLLATQAASRIQAAFGVSLPIKTLFENPTPAALADAVVARTLEEGEASEMASLLGRLEGMDDASAARLLAEMEKKEDR